VRQERRKLKEDLSNPAAANKASLHSGARSLDSLRFERRGTVAVL
jgi:hypothetical protein